jgi:hypothetical protein
MIGQAMFRSPAAEAIAGAFAAGSLFFGGKASAGFSSGAGARICAVSASSHAEYNNDINALNCHPTVIEIT